MSDSKSVSFSDEARVARSLSVGFYIAFCIGASLCLRPSSHRKTALFIYLFQFMLEVWLVALIDFNNVFLLSSFYALFNLGFFLVYIYFAHEINVGIFCFTAFGSLLLFSGVYFFMDDIEGKVHMILNPFSSLVACFFFVIWIILYLFTENKFDQYMYLKFPFEVYAQFGRIFSKNLL